MKSFRDYLKEATRPQQAADDEPKRSKPTKDKEDDWSGLDDLFAPKADQPLTTRPEPEQDRPRDEPQRDDPRGRTASQGDTQRAAGRITPSDDMRNMLNRMRDIETDDEDDGYPEPEVGTDLTTDVTTDNLPAVAGQALQAAGTSNPDWHKVSNLPGNMSRAIRTLGKQLFRSFTSTNTNDIQMIGNVNGQGPNTTAEVNAVASWLRANADDVATGDIDFDNSIPGYTADIKQYSAAGIRWLLVRDQFGNYIYSWPEQDSIQTANQRRLER